MIHLHGKEFLIEIQNGEKPEGIFCSEGIEVKIDDEGGGPFLCLKTRNLEPTEDYDSNTVSIEESDIEPLCDALKKICEWNNGMAKNRDSLR